MAQMHLIAAAVTSIIDDQRRLLGEKKKQKRRKKNRGDTHTYTNVVPLQLVLVPKSVSISDWELLMETLPMT